jgi:peptidoglycan hydrolase CwlO-like protein
MLTCKTSDSGYEIGITTHKANKKIIKNQFPTNQLLKVKQKKLILKKSALKKLSKSIRTNLLNL